MRSKKTNQSGIHIIVLAGSLVALFSLVGLVVTMSLMLSNKAKLQNSVNLATLGAEERLMESVALGYSARADLALERANQVLATNPLIGASAFGDLRHQGTADDAGGVLELGMYYPFRPTNGSNPCVNYPCYIPNAGPPSSMPANTPANTARITAHNQPTNPVILPFAKMLGVDQLSVTAPSSATMIQRCTAFVLDVSPSVSLQTHKVTTKLSVPVDNPGALAFKEYSIQQVFADEAAWGRPCKASDYNGNPIKTYFCQMPLSRLSDFDPKLSHYRSDYVAVNTMSQQLRFDLFNTPEPFRTFLLAYNAGLRKLVEQQTVSDKFVFVAFDKNMVDRIPSQGLTSDLSYLEQITNLDNIGKVNASSTYVSQPIHPNLLDRGWASPIGIDGYTNLILGLHQAIGALADPSVCPVSARKSIVLASDGIINVDYDRASGTTDSDITYEEPLSGHSTYLQAEQHLLGLNGTPGASNNPILYDLIQNKIRVTAIVTGSHVLPNFKNVLNDSGTGYIDFDKAIGRGYHGIPTGKEDPLAFIDTQSVIDLPHGPQGGYLVGNPGVEICTDKFTNGNPDSCAWENAGVIPGIAFRRAVGVMGELSLRTGGVFCPLMPTAPDPSCYVDGKLKDCCRNGAVPSCGGPGGSSSFQTYSLTDRGAAVDAADCVLKTLGQNPYRLLPSGAIGN